MKVIIAGGTGFIGRALTASMLGDGHVVVILTRNPGAHRDGPEGMRAVLWDGRTAGDWQAEVDGADAIVNLAGASIADGPWTEARKRLIVDSRVNAGRAVAAAVAAATTKPKVLIQASAVGYYGPSGDEVVTEDSPPGSDFLAGACSAWESSSFAVEAMGVRRAVIRTGVVLASDGGALPKMLLPFKLFAGGPVGSGRQVLPWIHIADEVAAIRHLIDNASANGPYNLSAPHPVTNAEFSRAIGRVMHRPAFMPAPAFVLRLVFGEMATVLLDGQRAVPKRLQEDGFIFRFEEAEDALAALI